MAAFHSAFVGKRQSPVDEPSVKPHWLAARPVAAWFAAAYVFAPKQFAFFSHQLASVTDADGSRSPHDHVCSAGGRGRRGPVADPSRPACHR
jgi:hypothetical protein